MSGAQQTLQRHGVTVIIIGCIAALAAVIGYETDWGRKIHPNPKIVATTASKSNDTAMLPAISMPAIDSAFKDSVERPLFNPTRRPPPPVVATLAPQMKRGQYKLSGTVMNNEAPYAFLVEVATGKGVRVAQGAEIVSTGISVASVDALRVVLKMGEETEELTLRTASSPPLPVAPPGAVIGPVPGMPQGNPLRPAPPNGVVVGAIPTFPAGAALAPVPQDPRQPPPGRSAMPGFVLSPPPAEAAAAAPADAAGGNQRRRRFPNAPGT